MGVWVASYLMGAVAAHSFLGRLARAGTGVGRFLMVATPLGLALFVHAASRDGLGPTTVAALVVYAFACELYVFLFTLVASSVSASLLMALASGGLTRREISALCDEEGMVRMRLERLVRGGLLRAAPAGYAPTRAARVMLAGFRMLRRFFRHA